MSRELKSFSSIFNAEEENICSAGDGIVGSRDGSKDRFRRSSDSMEVCLRKRYREFHLSNGFSVSGGGV